MKTTKTVSFYSLGCRANQYEIQAIREKFLQNGYAEKPFGQKTDFAVINSCAVTGESERKTRNIIARAAKTAGSVVVTGCYAELCRRKDIIPENISFLGGSSQKNTLFERAVQGFGGGYTEKSGYEELSIGNTKSLCGERYRAYVKIQDGCNFNCAYCIIPKLRGRSFSRGEPDILGEIKRLAEKGVSEVILTGIEVSDYGAANLCRLINKIDGIDGIRRIRIGSLNPNALTDEFISCIGESKKFCRHLHLSVQSGSGDVLKNMRRPYSAEKLQSAIDRLYEKIPDISLTADIISGFPGETDEDHQKTLEFIKKNNFTHIHAFAFSKRPYTDAATFAGQVTPEIKKRRNRAVLELSSLNKEKAAAKLFGKKVEILAEKNRGGFVFGHTDGFMEAKVRAAGIKAGDYACFTADGFDKTDSTLILK
ncbi:MAG: tRNA (N(6)-L-threonylcarbamoyladenosine(37)-C(2))-methylthiotransferase MtaB [Eubacteriales bacterium]